MANHQIEALPGSLIDFGSDEFLNAPFEAPGLEPEDDDPVFGEWMDLVQNGTNRTVAIKDAYPDPTKLSLPETKKFDEYKSPLTHELMQKRYLKLYSAYTEGGLCNTEPKSPAWEAIRQDGKKEITIKFLHKPGLPSEFMQFLDIDVKETRELLDGIYFSIPEEVDRDNHVNNFDKRAKLVKKHILFTHRNNPEIKEELQDTIDIWREDLLLRARMMDGTASDELAIERQGYVEQLAQGNQPPWELIHKIGSTLLHATDEEKSSFERQLRELTPESEHAVGNIALLTTFIREYHPTK